MTTRTVRTVAAAALACVALVACSATAQAQIGIQIQPKPGINIGIGFGGNHGFGNQGFGNQGFGNPGFNVFAARELANDIRQLSQRGLNAAFQGRFDLRQRELFEVVEGLRTINRLASDLQFFLQVGRFFDARIVARQLEGVTDDFLRLARQLRDRNLDDLARDLERLADQLKRVID